MLEGIGANAKSPPTPHLVYQHYFLGKLYQLLPDWNNVFGYNWMHILSQVIFLFFLVYKNSKNYLWYVFALLIGMLNFFLPQYSITPFLLLFCAARLVCTKKDLSIGQSTLTFILINWSSMIRIEPYLFGLIIFFPYVLPYLKKRRTMATLSLSVLTSLLLSGINYYYTKSSIASGYFYQGLERKIILDYRGGEELLKHEKEVEKLGLSKNDINFFRHWLLLDPEINQKIISPEVMAFTKPSFLTRLKWGIKALLYLKSKRLVFLFLILFLSIIITRKKSALVSGVIFLMAIFYSGYLGRYPLIRVYLGPMLFLIPLNLLQIKQTQKSIIPIIISFICLGYFTIFDELKATKEKAQISPPQLNWLLDKLNKSQLDLYWWPYASAFADDFYRIKNLSKIKDLTFVRPNYNWGDASDPKGERRHKKFKQDFTTKGIHLLFEYEKNQKNLLPIFSTYCSERLRGNMVVSNTQKKEINVILSTVKCVPL